MSKTNSCKFIARSFAAPMMDEMTAEKALYEGIGNRSWNGKRLGAPFDNE